MNQSIRTTLNDAVNRFNAIDFIENDPISIPHRFTKKQDIEIAGLIASLFAWGQRKTIINKALEFIDRMDSSPYDFIRFHQEHDRKRFLDFKHRTWNETDSIYFIYWLQKQYHMHNSLENVFLQDIKLKDNVEPALIQFNKTFIKDENFPKRTGKHVASPYKNSACKRLNMYLRWMVRNDNKGVDFGLWNKIKMNQLVCPLDVHVGRVARSLNLLHRDKNDWQAAVELTTELKKYNPDDPVQYDFALFGLGISGK